MKHTENPHVLGATIQNSVAICHPVCVEGYHKLRILIHIVSLSLSLSLALYILKVFITRYGEVTEVQGALLSIVSDGCLQVTA
jgi:hypothetical protein